MILFVGSSGCAVREREPHASIRSEQVGKAADWFLDEYLWFAQAIVQAKQAGEIFRPLVA